jgi:hypothetical protein
MEMIAADKLAKLGFKEVKISKSLDLFGNQDSIISFTFDKKRYQIYESSFLNLLTMEPQPLPSRILKLVI